MGNLLLTLFGILLAGVGFCFGFITLNGWRDNAFRTWRYERYEIGTVHPEWQHAAARILLPAAILACVAYTAFGQELITDIAGSGMARVIWIVAGFSLYPLVVLAKRAPAPDEVWDDTAGNLVGYRKAEPGEIERLDYVHPPTPTFLGRR